MAGSSDDATETNEPTDQTTTVADAAPESTGDETLDHIASLGPANSDLPGSDADQDSNDQDESADPEALATDIATAATAAGMDEDEARELIKALGPEKARKHLQRLTDFSALTTPAAPKADAGATPATPAAAAKTLSALSDDELKKIGEDWGDSALVDAVIKPLNDKLKALTEFVNGLNVDDVKTVVDSFKSQRQSDFTRYCDGIFDKFSSKGWEKVLGSDKAPNREARRDIVDKAAALVTTIRGKGGKMTDEQAIAAVLNSSYGNAISGPEARTSAVKDIESRVVARSRQLTLTRGPGTSGRAPATPETPKQARDRKIANIAKTIKSASGE